MVYKGEKLNKLCTCLVTQQAKLIFSTRKTRENLI